jgi:DNA-binding IclR family transcriptional regulator
MAKREPYPGTQAVMRAISLLKYFSDEQPEWGLTELAEKCGLNKTTTFRLLTALESEALVARGLDGDRYRLGPSLITLGGVAIRSNDLRTLCRPELKALAAAVNETASLELLTGSEVLILDEVLGERVMTGSQAIGTRWPAHATSTGKAILAHLPPTELELILQEPRPPLTPHTLTDRALLLGDLAATRARGYAIANEEMEIGLVAVAAPLFNYDGEVVGAISLAGPRVRLTSDRLPIVGDQLRGAARRISAQLGHAPDATP